MKTKITFKITLFLTVMLILSSCSKSDETATNSPVITPKGTESGEIATKILGTDGGTITSTDGNLTLNVPQDALTSNTEISIQPITNEGPLGIGSGYRLLPEGTTFSKLVKLTFKYNAEMLNGISPEFLWIITQASDGSWNAALRSVVDTINKTVSFEAPHFSDWALGRFIDFTLNPASKVIRKGSSIKLKLSGFSRDKAMENDDLVPLVPITADGDDLTPLTPIPPVESRLIDFRVKQWTLNGVAAPVTNSSGSLSASGTMATYTAPEVRPNINPVAVTVQLETNDKEGQKSSFMLTSNITIAESNYYLFIKFKGQTYEYYQYGFNGTIPSDPNNLQIANCAISEGKLQVAGTSTINGSSLVNGFGLVFANPKETSRRLSGFNENGSDDIGFQFYPSDAYTIDYTDYTYDAAHNICNYVYKCSNITVTITSYSKEKNEALGYFKGELYEETTSANWDNCKTAEKFTIEGEFNLYVINM